MKRTTQLFAVSVLALISLHCGEDTGEVGKPIDCTLTNTCGNNNNPPPPPPPPPPLKNLEQYSLAKGSSEYTRTGRKDYKSHFVRDGKVGNAGQSWHSNAEGAGAQIKLKFPAEVKISKIDLFDNPDSKFNLLSGFMSFRNSVTNQNLADINFGALPADASRALTIASANGYVVDELTLHITDYDDQDPNFTSHPRSGLAEIKVLGDYVAKEITQSFNIARYSMPDDLGTEVKHYLVNDTSTPQDERLFEDQGNFGAFNVIDDEAADGISGGRNCEALTANRDSYKTQAAGPNTRIKLGFGRIYKVEKVVVYDLQNATTDAHVRKFQLKFSDGTVIDNIMFDDVNHPFCKVIDLPEVKLTDSIQINTIETVPAADTTRNTDVGFAEIRVFGTY